MVEAQVTHLIIELQKRARSAEQERDELLAQVESLDQERVIREAYVTEVERERDELLAERDRWQEWANRL